MKAAARGVPQGFSLIEMLVALAVFALVVVGLLNLAGESTRTAVQVEESVLGNLVADNLAAEAQLADAASLSRPAQGTTTLGGRQWSWTRSAASRSAGLLRVEIRVADEGGREAASAWVFR